MDVDLKRSLRMLEDSMAVGDASTSRTNLLKRAQLIKAQTIASATGSGDLDASLENYFTNIHEAFSSTLLRNKIENDRTLTGSVITSNKPWKNTLNILYVEFFEILQAHSQSSHILDLLSDIAACCVDALQVVKGLKSKVSGSHFEEDDWLEIESNTWRLLHVLFQDRIYSEYQMKEQEEPAQYAGYSEKLCMLSLFARDNLVRETQLVADWLESCAAARSSVTSFNNLTVGWENTLHQLNAENSIVFGSTREIVTRVDPDAPNYQGKPLHDIDADNEKELCRSVFQKIRGGKLSEAQKLCIDCGHAWRAALFEGWRLYHHPNIELIFQKRMAAQERGEEFDTQSEVICDEEVTGNPNRDLWKTMALKYCEKKQLNMYEKASIAVYCGHLKTLLQVCSDWEDYLWAHMRVMIDIRVESELRDFVNKTYRPLPDFYWNQRMSLNEIFSTLESSINERVKLEAHRPERIIQKLIILDDIPQVFQILDEWMDDENISPQFLRFSSHLVLFMEKMGRATSRDVIDKVLERYIKCLMEMNETQLVAFYVSNISRHLQIPLYSSYLENIVNADERKASLEYADNCGLNVTVISKTVVQNIRNHPIEVLAINMQQTVTASDEFKISSLDWLLIHENNRLEALIQCNALIFQFFTAQKFDAAHLAFNKIPPDSIKLILQQEEESDELNQIIHEYMSYKMYLDAQEAFNLWFKHYNTKPVQPSSIPEDAHLTEKVAYEHRMSQHKADLERWKLNITHLSKTAKTLLYNVLLFPGDGWLSGVNNAKYLQSKCIPECVLLLCKVLTESDLHSECIQLADILASEKYGLYKVYSKESMEHILEKFAETSIALLNEKKDPWGNDIQL